MVTTKHIQVRHVGVQKKGRERIVGAGPRACPVGAPRWWWYTNRAGTGTCPYDCTPNPNTYANTGEAPPRCIRLSVSRGQGVGALLAAPCWTTTQAGGAAS